MHPFTQKRFSSGVWRHWSRRISRWYLKLGNMQKEKRHGCNSIIVGLMSNNCSVSVVEQWPWPRHSTQLTRFLNHWAVPVYQFQLWTNIAWPLTGLLLDENSILFLPHAISYWHHYLKWCHLSSQNTHQTKVSFLLWSTAFVQSPTLHPICVFFLHLPYISSEWSLRSQLMPLPLSHKYGYVY